MIRKATMQDLRRIMEMSHRFYPHTSYAIKSKIPLDDAHLGIFVEGMVENHLVHVAEVDGKVVGLIALIYMPFMFNPDYITAGEVIWWVEPEYWKSGIGRELLLSIDEPCRERGIKHVQMMAMANSTPDAHKLYLTLGYELSEISYTKVL